MSFTLTTEEIGNLVTQVNELRATNATLMHQNADLTRENDSLKSELSNLRPSAQSADT